MRKRGRIRGRSYRRRVSDIQRIYDEHAKDGLSNREILRRFIQPEYPIAESTLYNILKVDGQAEPEEYLPSLFDDIDNAERK